MPKKLKGKLRGSAFATMANTPLSEMSTADIEKALAGATLFNMGFVIVRVCADCSVLGELEDLCGNCDGDKFVNAYVYRAEAEKMRERGLLQFLEIDTGKK